MDNIGFVIYSRSNGESSLDAKWSFCKNNAVVHGTGIAKGKNGNGLFEGEFRVTYFDSGGKELGSFDLVISSDNGTYLANWKINNQVMYVGIGYKINDQLCIGWRVVGS